ncbi:hypothetical protein HDU79_001908 [Rhizoclosmatium sp. JEL0117]|nr:hypothetical protein HDU79_001908 [Rhizoclosmatium sp. JEL0117]
MAVKQRKTPTPSPASSEKETATVEAKEPKRKPREITDELGDFILLIFLYLLQGIPMGLIFGSVPFLLKAKLSYSDIALFSLSSYPYSLKAITGVFLLVLARSIDHYVSIENTDPVPVTFLALTFASLIFLCATQDIAVDGWALTLLTEENKAYASTAQTIGLNTGYFLSFTVFLALNSKEFCVKYLGYSSELILLGQYLSFWGVMFLLCDVWLIFMKNEGLEADSVGEDDISTVYKEIFQVISLPNMKRLIFMTMVSKIGFMAHDSVSALKLLEKGFSKEDLALTVLIDFPIQIFVGYYVAKWSSGPKPLRPWLNAFYVRLGFSALGMLIVQNVPEKIDTSFFIFVIVTSVLNSMISTVMFVGIGSYYTKISDPRIGGTYMTLLNTINNLAGTWPKYFILQSVEYLTDAQCILPPEAGHEPFKCTSDSTKAQCKTLNGLCDKKTDGYYPVSIACVLTGVIVLFTVVRPTVNEKETATVEAKEPKRKPREITDELGDFILLIFLYLLQGIPMGLIFGSVPFLLKAKLSYSDIALFSLSSYPYSLKAITGVFLLVLARSIDHYVSIENTDPVPVTFLALTFASLIFLCATQDIAVDGWALTLLTEENKAYASTAQTIGLNTGYFLSFTVFLALNSKEFCVKYLGYSSELILLGQYLSFWGVMFLLCDVWLIFMKNEGLEADSVGEDDISTVYKEIFQVISLPNMKRLIFMTMVSKIGFMAHDSVSALKLLEKGFSKEDLALTVLIDFPIQIFVGYYVAKWSSGPKPLRPWLNAFYVRLGFSALGMLIVQNVPEKIDTSFFIFVIITSVLNSMISTVMFVGIGSYYTKISDPRIGGTYMTLLNTINNLAGTWPKYFILQSVEYLTDAQCILPPEAGHEPFKCTSDSTKAQCKTLNGLCDKKTDGYYPVSIACVLTGVIVLFTVVRPTVKFLERVPDLAWRVPREGDEEERELLAKGGVAKKD